MLSLVVSLMRENRSSQSCRNPRHSQMMKALPLKVPWVACAQASHCSPGYTLTVHLKGTEKAAGK